MSQRRSLARAVLVAAVVVAVDQLTKAWALDRLVAGPCVPDGDGCIDLIWTLRLHLVFNRGAAFSTGPELGPVFGVIALVMTVVLLNLARQRTDRWSPLLFGLIAGGAVGNLIDRVVRADDGPLSGAVVDFVDLQWWPVFNVADAAVVVGVITFIALAFLMPDLGGDRAERGADAAADPDDTSLVEAGADDIPLGNGQPPDAVLDLREQDGAEAAPLEHEAATTADQGPEAEAEAEQPPDGG